MIPQKMLNLKKNQQQTKTLLWFTFLWYWRSITFYSINFVALSSLNFQFIWSYWRHFSFCLQNKIEDLLFSVYNIALTIYILTWTTLYFVFTMSHWRASTFCLQRHINDPLLSFYSFPLKTLFFLFVYNLTIFFFLFTVSHKQRCTSYLQCQMNDPLFSFHKVTWHPSSFCFKFHFDDFLLSV